MSQHLYHHAFQNGVLATATIVDDPPGFEVCWEGQPTRQLLPEYRAWREAILADFHERTGKLWMMLDLP